MDFLEAIQKLINEEIPSIQVQCFRVDEKYLHISESRKTSFYIYEDCVSYWFEENHEYCRFNIANPKFDPYDIIKFIRQRLENPGVRT